MICKIIAVLYPPLDPKPTKPFKTLWNPLPLANQPLQNRSNNTCFDATRRKSDLTLPHTFQMDQIRGGRRGGREQVVQTPRGHPLPALALRAAQSHPQRDGGAGHGGCFHGADSGPHLRQHGGRGRAGGREEGQGEGGAAQEAQAPAPEEEPRAADHQVVRGDREEPVRAEK